MGMRQPWGREGDFMKVPVYGGLALCGALLPCLAVYVLACNPLAEALRILEASLVLGLLAAASVHDLRTRLIPNGYALGILALHGLMLGACLIAGMPASVRMAAASLAGFAALGGGSLAVSLAFEQASGAAGMGGGDIKLLFALGFALGAPGGFRALLVACLVFCLGVGLARLARALRTCGHGSAIPGEAYPFVPALAVGAAFAYVLA